MGPTVAMQVLAKERSDEVCACHFSVSFKGHR